MNTINKAIIFSVLAILLSALFSCDTFDNNKHLGERYYLKYSKFGKSISYKVDNDNDYVELLDVNSASIGFDNNYIIVKSAGKGYYIISIYKGMNYFPEKGVFGPYNLSEFNKQKQKLNIKAEFTLTTN